MESNHTDANVKEITLAFNSLNIPSEDAVPGLTPDSESPESLPPTPPGSPSYSAPIHSALLRRRIDSLRDVPELIHPPIRLPKASSMLPHAECLRVLLVDDNDVNLRILDRLLKKHLSHIIHTVHFAQGADQALQLLSTINFDLVMMDIEMPGMSGVEAAARIRAGMAGERHRLIPIVAVTTKFSPYWRSLYLENGMNGCISKPIVLDTLMDTVNDILCRDSIESLLSPTLSDVAPLVTT
ncbi:hypothetical protein INT44_001764 [Umbelopsis vinacea]|uniref:Response regulatory domain-containing protein n=1 Tax=Umbelopsis vinacea TaxID=44442 RepID=A0A8H7UAQ5_9FUNG|nr:hypothetical protein INT44_001764 [Umbelopsis vinacea]